MLKKLHSKKLLNPILLIIAIYPVWDFASHFISEQPRYFYTDGLPAGASSWTFQMWTIPLLLIMAVQFDFVREHLHGFYLNRLTRYQTRQRYFVQLYQQRIGRQLGLYLALIALFAIIRLLTHHAILPPDWRNLWLSVSTFIVLCSLQFLLSLFFEPLLAYLFTSGYLLLTLSLEQMDYGSWQSVLLFPNALMGQRIAPHVSLYVSVLAFIWLLVMGLSWMRVQQLDLI